MTRLKCCGGVEIVKEVAGKCHGVPQELLRGGEVPIIPEVIGEGCEEHHLAALGAATDFGPKKFKRGFPEFRKGGDVGLHMRTQGEGGGHGSFISGGTKVHTPGICSVLPVLMFFGRVQGGQVGKAHRGGGGGRSLKARGTEDGR